VNSETVTVTSVKSVVTFHLPTVTIQKNDSNEVVGTCNINTNKKKNKKTHTHTHTHIYIYIYIYIYI
jgi:hypothetical protein